MAPCVCMKISCKMYISFFQEWVFDCADEENSIDRDTIWNRIFFILILFERRLKLLEISIYVQDTVIGQFFSVFLEISSLKESHLEYGSIFNLVSYSWSHLNSVSQKSTFHTIRQKLCVINDLDTSTIGEEPFHADTKNFR